MQKRKINRLEKLKISLKPIDFLAKIDGLDATRIGEEERFYLKNFGIYNHKVTPDRFTLRVRITAGRIATELFLRLYDEVQRREGRLLLTSRGQIEVHGLSFLQVRSLFRALPVIGLSSWQTFSDNIRNIVADPLDGLVDGGFGDVIDLIRFMERFFLGQRGLVGMLPRKFNVAITAIQSPIVSFFGNDLFFAPACKEERMGFNLYVGGKNSEEAKALDLFVVPERVVEVFEAIVILYRKEGPRQSRSKARLFHMIEEMGLEAFRQAVCRRLGWSVSQGKLLLKKGSRGSVYPLSDGTYAYRYGCRFGEVGHEQIEEIAALKQRYGFDELRIGCDQHLYLPGLPEGVDFEYASDEDRAVLACAGSRYCNYALLDTKRSAKERLSGLEIPENVRIGLSGCLKGCGRHALSDIGLVGIRTKLFTQEVERGVRLYLGALYSHEAKAGRLILYAVPQRHLKAMVTLLIILFQESGFGDFEAWSKAQINRFSPPALAFWVLYRFCAHYRWAILVKVTLEGFVEGDEKAFFLRQLEKEKDSQSREVTLLLQKEEAFDFREAIIYLERKAFAK